jgi:carboxylate-amine ligase
MGEVQPQAPVPQRPAPGQTRDELVFHSSPGPSVGVELELPILDRETGELVPGAPRILQACGEDATGGVGAEIMQSMIELRTGVCDNVGQVRDELIPRLRRVRNIATAQGCDFAMLGTHPFLRPGASPVSASERYETLWARWAWMTYYRVTFGLHIHVGMSSGDQAVAVMHMAMRYLPHLLAVSANSPFWDGVDTGLASCRAVLYSMVPHSGVPIVFDGWKDFRPYYQVMRDGQAIASYKDIKWDLRPRPDLGTLEFRICDTPASLATLLGLVALTRTLAISAQRLLAERPRLRHGDRRRSWITVENRWLASRYGLKALYLRTPGGKRRLLAEDLPDLVAKLMPIAHESGDDRFLAIFQKGETVESGAERQRQLYRQSGHWKPVMQDLMHRYAQELDKITPAAPARAMPPGGA